MDAKGLFVEGGVRISHVFLDSEHRYKVDMVSINSRSRGPAFARKGDMLTLINDTQLAKVPPEELAHLLTSGNPKLTVHQVTGKKEHPKPSHPEKDTLYPYKKESTVLCFSMEMRRDEELGQGESSIGGGGRGEEGGEGGKDEEGGEGGKGEDGVGPAEEGEQLGMLVVKLTNTSISVVKGRGCQEGCPYQDCPGTGCTFNEVVIVTHSSTVTLVPGNFKLYNEDPDICLENVVSKRYLRSLSRDNMIFTSDNPEKITIYYYKPDVMDETFRGMPVALKFTDSQSFLKCGKEGGKVILGVEACDKQRLKQICKKDDSALAFLFYMKGNKSGQRRFESVLCPGWFIHTLDQDEDEDQEVKMGHQPADMDPAFYFIIQT